MVVMKILISSRQSNICIEVLYKLGSFIDKKVTFDKILENILSLTSKSKTYSDMVK
jgi:hypothetical protein